MRVRILQRVEVDSGWYVRRWRVVEWDGTPCRCWAPGLEWPDPEGPLDRGGFDRKSDAKAFALGVDRWRAEKRLIRETVQDIDRERRKLDGRVPLPELDDVELDDFEPAEHSVGEPREQLRECARVFELPVLLG